MAQASVGGGAGGEVCGGGVFGLCGAYPAVEFLHAGTAAGDGGC